MKGKRARPRLFLAGLLALVLLAGALPCPALAVSQEEVDALRGKIDALEEKKKEYAASLAALSDDIDTVLERKQILDARIAATREQIEAVETLIRGYEEEQAALEADIELTRHQLSQAQAKAENTYELYCRRVRALEEEGAVSYWNILFGAGSFSDLLTRLDFVGEVLSYNEEVILGYNDVCREITGHQEELEASLQELQEVINRTRSAQEELQARSVEINEERAAANEMILEIMADQDRYASFLQLLDAQWDATDREIAAQEAALEAQRLQEEKENQRRAQASYVRYGGGGTASKGGGTAAPVNSGSAQPVNTGTQTTGAQTADAQTADAQTADAQTADAQPADAQTADAQPADTTGGTGYAWPVNSRKINSDYGERDAAETGGIGSTNHKGIDIGNVGYGTEVGAAASGTVIRAGDYGDGYGNCVVIKHEDGSTTLYAHMQSVDVSAGDTVGQLDKIGETGATGAATGPHLHFEIRVDGTTVDPEEYLP